MYKWHKYQKNEPMDTGQNERWCIGLFFYITKKFLMGITCVINRSHLRS